MRTYKRIQVYETIFDTITCNKCGLILPTDDYEYGFEGICVRMVGGYGSKHLGDNNSCTFDVCEKCVLEYVKTFAVPADFEDS